MQWTNLYTGAGGETLIPAGSPGEPGFEPAVAVTTGPGRIAAVVTGEYWMTLGPGVGTFMVP